MSSPFADKPLFNISIFTPKPGRLDDFLAAQLAGLPRLGAIRGLNQSRTFRAENGSRAVLMSGFDSLEAFRDFQNGAPFQAERARLLPLLEKAEPGFFRLVQDRVYG